MITCNCPLSAAIIDIDPVDCIERFGQIQKIILQRTRNGTVINKITIATSDPTLLATWTALQAAVDSEKVQITPYIHSPANEAGEAITYGGGNQTVGGVPIPLGKNPSPFTSDFLDVPQSVVTQVEQYTCEPALSVFFVNEKGQIAGQTDNSDTPDTFYGFEILNSLFVSDKILGNKEVPDRNIFAFTLIPNWSSKFHVITPAFNALLEL